MNPFFAFDHPPITVMFNAQTSDDAINIIKNSLNQGVEAFCFLTESLLPEYKTEETIKAIIKEMQGKPLYVTNYIRNNSQQNLSDDILADQLLKLAEYGGDLIDIRGDMFLRTPDEITFDCLAVKKQKELISKIHSMNNYKDNNDNKDKKVIMSTHIFGYRSPAKVLEIAKAQEERGADIAKIVTEVNSEKEVDDAFKTIILLKENLNIPFLFLNNGTHCKKTRLLVPLLGMCMYLSVENSVGESNPKAPQPTISKAKEMLSLYNEFKEFSKN